MIFAVAALVLPCLTSTLPAVTYAKPSDPQYEAMTHIRVLPAPICEPLVLAPLVDGPGEPIALAEVPMVPVVPADAPPLPYAPLVWGPLDWPAGEGGYGGGFYAGGGGFGGGGGGGYGGGSGGGCCYCPPGAPTITPVPEPFPLALLGAGLIAIGLWGRRRAR